MSNFIPCPPGMTFEQCESYQYAYCWHVGKRRCSAFPTPRIDNSRLLNRFKQTGNVADRPRSGRLHKTMLREDYFLQNLVTLGLMARYREILKVFFYVSSCKSVVGLYQESPNCSPGVTSFTWTYKGKTLEISLYLKP